MTTPKRHKRVKIEANLFKVGDSYVYRRGDFEESLGRFPNDEKAKEAKQIFEAMRDRLGSEAFVWRVKHLWPDYVEERRQQMIGSVKGRKTISPRTLEEINQVWDAHLKKFFANKKLSDIDSVLWNEYCRKSKVADLTNHRKVLGTFLRWCEQNGKVRYIPTMKIPEVVRRKRKTLTPDQIKAILKHSQGSLLLFVSLYLFMGVRRGEQIQLRWEFVNLDENWILIPDETTRTRKGRVIPLNLFVRDILIKQKESQIERGIDSPWVFPKAGRPDEHATKDAPNKAWKNMLIEAEIQKSGIEPHDLRATYEHYANKRAEFTDTQREKMAGASIQVQRRIYLHGYQADDLRGLEEVVKVEGLESIVNEKIQKAGEKTGMTDSYKTKARRKVE